MNDNVINNWDEIPEWKTGKSQISHALQMAGLAKG